jgi:acetyl esterase/lipase
MYRALLVATLLAGFAVASEAQNSPAPVKLSDVAGVWDYRATIAPNNVVSTSTLTATADGKSWTIRGDNGPFIPVRVVSVAADSIVAEAGPYASTYKPGQSVEVNHIVLHYHGGAMTGYFEAHYNSGDVVTGTVNASRRKMR